MNLLSAERKTGCNNARERSLKKASLDSTLPQRPDILGWLLCFVYRGLRQPAEISYMTHTTHHCHKTTRSIYLCNGKLHSQRKSTILHWVRFRSSGTLPETMYAFPCANEISYVRSPKITALGEAGHISLETGRNLRMCLFQLLQKLVSEEEAFSNHEMKLMEHTVAIKIEETIQVRHSTLDVLPSRSLVGACICRIGIYKDAALCQTIRPAKHQQRQHAKESNCRSWNPSGTDVACWTCWCCFPSGRALVGAFRTVSGRS